MDLTVASVPRPRDRDRARLFRARLLRLATCLTVAPLIAAASPRAAQAKHFQSAKQHYALDYPDSWSVNTDMLAVDGPLFLDSFPQSERVHGGGLPPGGMEIEVTAWPKSADENQLIVPASGYNVVKSTQTIAHRGVLRADYDFPFADAEVWHCTTLMLRLGDTLYDIQLTYQHTAPDAKERAAGDAALERIVSSLTHVEEK